MLKLADDQVRELEEAMKSAPKAYVRQKAVALWNLSQGMSQRSVAKILNVSPTSVWAWVKRYRDERLAGLEVKPGRGRPAKAKLEEIEQILHRTPRSMGIQRTRWTLADLAATAPSLAGYSVSGVWHVLRRGRLSYKRGQPRVMSPDPDYVEKRALVGSASRSPGAAAGSGFAL